MGLKKLDPEALENQLNKGALWAVTYGDLMSYLMIFFLIMFSFSIGKTGAGSNATPAEKKTAEKVDESLANIQTVFGGKPNQKIIEAAKKRQAEENMAQKLDEAIKSQDLGKNVQVNANEERVQLVLKEAVLFDSGHAELKPKAFDILKEIANQVKTLPNEVVVAGHTDNVPIHGGHFASNWELSMARAYAVLKFFQDQGVDPKRLAGVGYGEFRPIADNSTPEGRAQNRRIDINLIRGTSTPTGGESKAPAPAPAPEKE
jgi:chemotaxis protein MotB